MPLVLAVDDPLPSRLDLRSAPAVITVGWVRAADSPMCAKFLRAQSDCCAPTRARRTGTKMSGVGAREDLLAAVRSLGDRGIEVFSPRQVLAEARVLGSTYPASTLRTFILGPMCVNSPDHHATQYGDLERVSRGLYRKFAGGQVPPPLTEVHPVEAVAEPEVASLERTSPLSYDDEWFWEGNVQAAVVSHLVAKGWRIRRVASTASSEHGVDIEAGRDAARLVVEVKGYPGTVYARGARQGEARSGSVGAQARTYFSNAVLSGLLMRTDHPDASVALAFPDVTTYSNLAGRVACPLHRCDVAIWLVGEDGGVAVVPPTDSAE